MLENISENLNKIVEIGPDRFRILLDFATAKLIPHLINDNYKYIWVHNHTLVQNQWKEFELPIAKGNKQKVLARNLNYEFIIETSRFDEIGESLTGGVNLVQLNKLPAYYFDLDMVEGNNRYTFLKEECDYLFELILPKDRDYGTIISHDRDYLQSLIEDPNIDWDHLP